MALHVGDDPFYYYNGILEPWFQMGYDGHFANLPENDFSLFYADYSPIHSSGDFHSEVENGLRRLAEKYGDLLIFDNGSFRSQYLQQSAQRQNLKFKRLHPFTISKETRDRVQAKLEIYQIFDPDLLYWACLAEEVEGPLLIPHLENRILNVSYSRRSQSTLGPSYYISIFNEKFYLFMKYITDQQKPLFSQLLMATPGIFRSFFFTDETQSWLHEAPGRSPHNYGTERALLRNSLGEQAGEEVPWPDLGNNTLGRKTYQQASAPLHRLFQKAFGFQTTLNKEAVSLYGTVR